MQDSIESIVSSIVSSDPIGTMVKTISKGIEFEVRFGINDGSSRFVPNLGYDVYTKIKESFKNQKIKSISEKTPLSIAMFNTNSSTHYRIERYFTADWKASHKEKMKKTQIAKIDTDYSIRFSTACEEPLDDDFVEDPIDQVKNKFRFRSRESFMISDRWRVDLTITKMIETIKTDVLREWKESIMEGLHSEKTRDEYNYEIELEYIYDSTKVEQPKEIIKGLKHAIFSIFSIIYKSPAEIDKQIRMNTFAMIKKTIVIPKLNYKRLEEITIKDISNQVVTVESRQISTIMNGNYTVTEKSDGERMLLWVNNGTAFFITSSNSLKKLQLSSPIIGVHLLDGEFINTESGGLFLVFDVLISRGINVTHMQFPKRQKIADDTIIMIKHNDATLSIIKKTFYEVSPDTFYQRNRTVIDTPREYSIDGLIYTSGKGGYFDVIYKWKMFHTIDFIMRKTGESDGKWHVDLYTRASRNDYIKNNWSFPANYKKYFPQINTETAEVFPFLFMPDPKNPDKWCKTSISTSRVKKLGLEDNTIVEFAWNDEKNHWVPLIARHDRTAIYKSPDNTSFYGNAYLTGYSIYNAIIRPLTQAMIVGDEPIPQSYWRAGDKSLIKAMLLFHSHVKIMAYEKYTKNALATLELGGGQANDFKKWIKAGIENVTIIEPDLDAIKEAEDRTRSIKRPMIEFINDSAGKDITMLLEENNSKNRKFDAIIANFSVHYFIENKEQISLLINNCKQLLKPNGYFIFTTFSGERVFIDLAKYNPLVLKSSEQKDKVLFSIEAMYPTTDPKIKHYGQKIKVFVESIGVAHEESLVNIKYIIDKFIETNEFTLVENTPFSEILDNYPEKGTLTEPERVYSSFNNLVVLRNGSGTRVEHPPAKVLSEKKSMGVKKNSKSKD